MCQAKLMHFYGGHASSTVIITLFKQMMMCLLQCESGYFRCSVHRYCKQNIKKKEGGTRHSLLRNIYRLLAICFPSSQTILLRLKGWSFFYLDQHLSWSGQIEFFLATETEVTALYWQSDPWSMKLRILNNDGQHLSRVSVRGNPKSYLLGDHFVPKGQIFIRICCKG